MQGKIETAGESETMNADTYEQLTEDYDLHALIKDGIQDISDGNTRPFAEAISEIMNRRVRKRNQDTG